MSEGAGNPGIDPAKAIATQLSNSLQNSTVVLHVLEAIGPIHPFLNGNVLSIWSSVH